jgi:type IV pilus assembly protein PilW
MNLQRISHRLAPRTRSRGLSLIELLVAVTIGALLIFGATKVYVDSKATYEVNESTARLQETARYALSVLEPDIRMSNYWGLVKGAGLVANQAKQTAASAGAPTNCNANFARDLLLNIEGTNNAYGVGCTAFGSGAVASADSLVIRRAAVSAPSGSATEKLRICSTRIAAQLVTDSSGCTAAPAGQINDLIVNGYYISKDSVQLNGLPALRRWALGTAAGTPSFISEEIIPAVEDLQIQYGIDTSGTSGVANLYMDPAAIPAGSQIVSVRIWVLVRAETPEVGFIDGATYEYADRLLATGVTADLNAAGSAGKAYRPNDRFRRLLVSRTVQIRNALGT